MLSALPPGRYNLTVEAAGRTVSYAEMIDLQPAAPGVVVTLSDRSELTLTALTRQTATGGQQFSSRAVSELPLNGRDFGTLDRNSFRGPAYYDYDFAFIKSTPFGHRPSGAERMNLQFRSGLFNLFNIVNMGLPANILSGSGFGQISKTAGTSRQIQFSLKLIN
jgi:hypothetical protein